MTRDIFRDLAEGAVDALRLYAALITAPFSVAKAFAMRTPGAPLEWARSGQREPPAIEDAGHS
jgi:hypothetical protein